MSLPMPDKLSAIVFSCLFAASSGLAQETVLYCTEQHIVGLQPAEGEWGPTYGNEDFGRRYAIRFSEDMSEMSGVDGGDTLYQCQNFFPNRASDVVTCMNTLVATMVFNYSTENGRFLFNYITPGGWLGQETRREEGKDPFDDILIMGTCQDF